MTMGDPRFGDDGPVELGDDDTPLMRPAASEGTVVSRRVPQGPPLEFTRRERPERRSILGRPAQILQDSATPSTGRRRRQDSRSILGQGAPRPLLVQPEPEVVVEPGDTRASWMVALDTDKDRRDRRDFPAKEAGTRRKAASRLEHMPAQIGFRGWFNRAFQMLGAHWGPNENELLLREYEHLVEAIREPAFRRYMVTVLSMIGGIGKTMTAAHILRILGKYRRRSQVIGVDINPDAGRLLQRMGRKIGPTLQEVWQKQNEDDLKSWDDIESYLVFDDEGIAVIAAQEGTARHKNFGGEEFRQVIDHMWRWSSGFVCDGGTQLLSHPIIQQAVQLSDVRVIVTDTSDDGYDLAKAALMDLELNEGINPRHSVILVINRVMPGDQRIAEFRRYFGETCFKVLEVDWDKALAHRKPVSLERLPLKVHVQYLRIVSAIIECYEDQKMYAENLAKQSQSAPSHPTDSGSPLQ